MERRASGELEEEIAEIRKRIETNLGELEHRLSREEVVGHILESGIGEYASLLGRILRENPIPAAITAFGLSWLTLAGAGYLSEFQRRPASPSLRRAQERSPLIPLLLEMMEGLRELKEVAPPQRAHRRRKGRPQYWGFRPGTRSRVEREGLSEFNRQLLLVTALALGGLAGASVPLIRRRLGSEEGLSEEEVERATAYAATPAAYDSTPSAEESARSGALH